MRTIFGALAVAAIAGCSLFGLDGLSGGDDAADAGDDGTTVEGGANGGDANVIGDGGGGDAAPSGPFCKTVGAEASVCDDFEEPGTFTGKWSEQDKYLGALEVKDGIGFGGSRGLAFSATPVGGGGTGANARVVLGWRTPTIASYVDTEVAVKITELPPTSYLAGPLYVKIDDLKGGYAAFGFELDGATAAVTTNPVVFPADSGAVSSGLKTVTTLSLGVWTRLRLVIDLGKSPPVLFAYADGALKHEQTIYEGFTPERISVRIGAAYAGTEDGGTIRMDLDDARIDWK